MTDFLDPQAWRPDDSPVTYKDNDDKVVWRGDPSVHDDVAALREQRATEHYIVDSLQNLRKAIGLTQVDVARHWNRPQSQVSRLEADPTRAELASIVAYMHAMGCHLTVEADIDGRVYRYEFT